MSAAAATGAGGGGFSPAGSGRLAGVSPLARARHRGDLHASFLELTRRGRRRLPRRGGSATFDLFQRFPLAGSGLGSFQAAFPLVQPPTIPGFWRHAHADWIELLPRPESSAFCSSRAGSSSTAASRQVILHGERSEGRAAGLAALGALVAVALHSCADFGLTMPANAFALAVVAGAAAATRLQDRL